MEPLPPVAADLQARVVERATVDPTFRQRLLADPRAAIEQDLRIPLPADIGIQVVEETPSRICLVLPAEHGPSEVAEADLGAVAGGAPLNIQSMSSTVRILDRR